MADRTRNSINEQQPSNAQSQRAIAQFADNRSAVATQLKQQTLMKSSPQMVAQGALMSAMSAAHVQQHKTIQRAAPDEELQMKAISNPAQLAGAEEELLQGKFAPVQRAEDEELLQGKFETAQLAEDEELLQGKFDTAQLAALEEEPVQGRFESVQRAEDEELLQGKFAAPATAQLEEKSNNTGLPNQLKAGIESLSGMSMDNVNVHYNSPQPAQLNAHAYAQGTDIHVAPGQEQHLPHEAWHVVQQAQGRVKPTMQMKAGVPVNDDVGLETEADVMGAKALGAGAMQLKIETNTNVSESSMSHLAAATQLAVYKEGGKNAVAVSAAAKGVATWVKKASVNPGGSNHIADVQARGMMGFKKGKTEHAGGRVFNNNPAPDGSRLPYAAGETYREWDVNPCVAGAARDAERIVTGSDGNLYYSNDHYNNFTQF